MLDFWGGILGMNEYWNYDPRLYWKTNQNIQETHRKRPPCSRYLDFPIFVNMLLFSANIWFLVEISTITPLSSWIFPSKFVREIIQNSITRDWAGIFAAVVVRWLLSSKWMISKPNRQSFSHIRSCPFLHWASTPATKGGGMATKHPFFGVRVHIKKVALIDLTHWNLSTKFYE